MPFAAQNVHPSPARRQSETFEHDELQDAGGPDGGGWQVPFALQNVHPSLARRQSPAFAHDTLHPGDGLGIWLGGGVAGVDGEFNGTHSPHVVLQDVSLLAWQIPFTSAPLHN